jgi:hypothetical protein
MPNVDLIQRDRLSAFAFGTGQNQIKNQNAKGKNAVSRPVRDAKRQRGEF